MKISVVTVTYNCQEFINRTIESVLAQTYQDLEYIIIDGCSTDATSAIIEKVIADDNRTKYISEPDNGIYNAMNKAITYISGDYVIFLNAGDYFYSKDTLSHIAYAINDMDYPDIINGNVIVYTPHKIDKIERKKFKRSLFIMANTVCHQGVLARAALFKEYSFDESYEYCADRDWLYHMFLNGKRFAYINEDITFYEGTGTSSQPDAKEKIVEERFRLQKKYCKRYYYVHKLIRSLFSKRKLSV